MSKPENTQPHPRKPVHHLRGVLRRTAHGQALVEYALITVLIVLAVLVAMLAAGPAVGNIFSNTVFNLIGGAAPSMTPLNPTEFWELVTAVASFTPQSVILPTNTLAPPTNTPTVGPSPTHTPVTPTATPTATRTPGPSPTPVDVIHDAPFYDNISNPNWWRLDIGSVFTGTAPWNIQWFSTGSTLSSVNSAMAGSPTCTSTSTDADINNRWGSGGPAPGGACSGSPWRSNYFATRWTRTVRFESDTPLTLTTVSDDGIRVTIDGSEITAITNWSYHGEQTLTTTYTFTGGVDHTVVVEYFEGTSSATMVFNMQRPNDNVGTCNWTMSNEYAHSTPTAWSDTPGANYNNNSKCYIALRGAVNLATLTAPPRMTFWDRWDLDNYDKAWVQIREYGSTGPWYAMLIHENIGAQLSWSREVVDLANYSAIDATTGTPVATPFNWTGRTIEFRFMLEADASNTKSGWWIDDVAVENNIIPVYTIGFWDNMESGDANWLPGGTWSLSGEFTRSGSGAWSDSVGGNYAPSTNASLELNGVVNLQVPECVNPELVFYSSWDLGTGDRIYVETSTDRVTWTSLTPGRTSGALQSESRNDAFIREAIPLPACTSAPFYLRFRLQSNSSTERDGWYIDDIAIQNHPTGNLPYPFFDNVEGGGANWLPDGKWAISPEEAYSGSAAWSDSPGANYADGSNSSLQTILPFLMTTSIATNPELSFWYRHDLASTDKLYVEASTNGTTWTALWSYQYTTSTSSAPEAPGTQLQEFNKQLAWEYVSIDMRSYISNTTPFYIRFRLDALTNSATANGAWIDDIRLAEHTETPHSLPFTDDMEGTLNWRAGGDWELHNEAAHSGSYAWSDSPGRDYYGDTWAVLELRDPIDLRSLASGSFPVLSWWQEFDLDRGDYIRVQVSTWTGPNWSNWSAWTEVYQRNYTANVAWHRPQVDLRPYIGKLIRLRFVLDALSYASDNDPGWWIDDVSVALYNPTVIPLDFYDGAESLDRWITEGTWGFGDIFRGTGSGPAALGPGLWTTRFYDLNEWTCDSMSTRASRAIQRSTFSCSGGTRQYTIQCQVSMGSINFVWAEGEGPTPGGTCTGSPWRQDAFAIHFARTITVEAGYYQFSLRHDDGARLYLDGNRIINQWYDTGPRTDTTSQYVTAGTHTLDVWYYESSGGATIQFDVARQSFSFHDSPNGDYAYPTDTTLTLNGVIDTTGAVNPALTWYDTYDVTDGSGACMLIEVSLPFEANQFNNWIEIYRQCDARNLTWTLRNIDLRAPIESTLGLSPGTFNFNGKRLALRFRLDARYSSDTDDGWWIDDIILAD